MKVQRALMAVFVSGLLALPVLAQSSATTPSGADQSSQSASPQSGQSSADKASMPQSDKDAGKSNATQALSRKDRMFMEKAAAGGLMEVDLGNAVKDKASDQQVKDFANKMVTDHSKANDELKNLMSQKGLSAPASVPAKEKSSEDKIEAKQGAELDKAYMAAMVKDHDADIKEFQNEAKSGNDPDVKAWATKTLPTLEEHQKLANDVAQKVGAEGNMKHGHESKKESKKESKNPS